LRGTTPPALAEPATIHSYGGAWTFLIRSKRASIIMRGRALMTAVAAFGCCGFALAAGAEPAQTDLIKLITLEQLLPILQETDKNAKIVQLMDSSSAIEFAMTQLKDNVSAYPVPGYCNKDGCLLIAFKAHLPQYDKIDAALINEWNNNLSIAKAALNPDGSSEFSHTFAVAGAPADYIRSAVKLFGREIGQYLAIVAQR
jgi:hypothetical protein